MGFTWQWANNDDDEDEAFVAYDDDVVDKLERALKKGARKVNVSATHYVDLSDVNEMWQKRKDDPERMRKVRRVELVDSPVKPTKAKKKKAPATKKKGQAKPLAPSKNARNCVLLPGAYYDHFDLASFSFRVALNAADKSVRFSFQFETKEKKPASKKSKKDADEEEEEEEGEDDWTSKAAWDNYGPDVSADWDFGELVLKTKSARVQLEGKTLSGFAEGTGVHCMDHQETRNDTIRFVKRNGNTFELQWTGDICVDGDEDNLKPFVIHSDKAELQGIHDGGSSVLEWFGEKSLFRSDGHGMWFFND